MANISTIPLWSAAAILLFAYILWRLRKHRTGLLETVLPAVAVLSTCTAGMWILGQGKSDLPTPVPNGVTVPSVDLSPVVTAIDQLGRKIPSGDQLAKIVQTPATRSESFLSDFLELMRFLALGAGVAFVISFILWRWLREKLATNDKRERGVLSWWERANRRVTFFSGLVAVITGTITVSDRFGFFGGKDSIDVPPRVLVVREEPVRTAGAPSVFVLENGVAILPSSERRVIARFLIPFDEASCKPNPGLRWKGSEPEGFEEFLSSLGEDLAKCAIPERERSSATLEPERSALVRVWGFASSSGFARDCPGSGDPDELNLQLANLRAKEVGKWLEKNLRKDENNLIVHVENWPTYESMNERRKFNDRLTSGHYDTGKGVLNRRVEVELLKAPACEGAGKSLTFRTYERER